MFIYLIERGDDNRYNYDQFDSHVIAANDTAVVRWLAAGRAADEGPDVWTSASIKRIGSYTGPRIRPHIILSSFNAG